MEQYVEQLKKLTNGELSIVYNASWKIKELGVATELFEAIVAESNRRLE
jgi:hypothetical protein